MNKHLILELDSDFEAGIRAKLEVKNDIRSLPQAIVRAKLSPNRELLDLYRQWQQRYASLEDLFRTLTHSNPDQITHSSSRKDAIAACQTTAVLVEAELNRWLNTCETFAPIRNELLQVGQGFRLWVQTDNPWLQRLPWEKWDLLSKAGAEIALIVSEYSTAERTQQTRDKIRILAVLGHATDLSHLKTDQEILDKIAGNAGAEIVWKQEPSAQVLNQLLRQGQWDILFFSGHSASTADGKRCEIQLTATHTLEIPDFRFALREATQQGLCLAIFNSCDGVGLAHQLAAERGMALPHLVFMREKLPDAVSPKFLQAFLEAFTRNQSLYASVHEAQKILHDDWEHEYPCASWLPVVCANPTEDPPRWERLSHGAQKQRRWRSLLKVIAISLTAAAVAIGVRELGWLEPTELAAYDQMMQQKPKEQPDENLFVITIDDQDILYQDQQYQDQQKMKRATIAGKGDRRSLSGEALSKLLTKLEPYKPTVIGLDILRPIFSTEDYPALATKLKQTPNLIGICSSAGNRVGPSPELPLSQIGFSDTAVDEPSPDRLERVRRYLFQAKFSEASPCLPPSSLKQIAVSPIRCLSDGYAPSFSLLVAQRYLEFKSRDFDCLKLEQGILNANMGDATIQDWLQVTLGPYRRQASESQAGRQIMLNYRRMADNGVDAIVKMVPSKPLRMVLDPSFNPESIRGKIVLIGVTRPNIDVFSTPFSRNPQDKVSGVYLHAQAVSQLLKSMLEKRPTILFLSPSQESIWIVVWAILGGITAWACVDFRILLIATGGSVVGLVGLSVVLFSGWALWLPLIPAGLAMMIAAGGVWIIFRQNVRRRFEILTRLKPH
jgi:CHASE2 domain-containing sensor protein